MKVLVYGINYDYRGGKNVWTAIASIYIDGHFFLDKAEFNLPSKCDSFSKAEALITTALLRGELPKGGR